MYSMFSRLCVSKIDGLTCTEGVEYFREVFPPECAFTGPDCPAFSEFQRQLLIAKTRKGVLRPERLAFPARSIHVCFARVSVGLKQI